MIRNLIGAVIERLVVKVLNLVAAQVDARLELDLAAVQVELLEQAERFEEKHGERAVVIIGRLRMTNERLGQYGVGEGISDLATSINEKSPETTEGTNVVDKCKRGRGRPRKEEIRTCESTMLISNNATVEQPTEVRP